MGWDSFVFFPYYIRSPQKNIKYENTNKAKKKVVNSH